MARFAHGPSKDKNSSLYRDDYDANSRKIAFTILELIPRSGRVSRWNKKCTSVIMYSRNAIIEKVPKYFLKSGGRLFATIFQ